MPVRCYCCFLWNAAEQGEKAAPDTALVGRSTALQAAPELRRSCRADVSPGCCRAAGALPWLRCNTHWRSALAGPTGAAPEVPHCHLHPKVLPIRNSPSLSHTRSAWRASVCCPAGSLKPRTVSAVSWTFPVALLPVHRAGPLYQWPWLQRDSSPRQGILPEQIFQPPLLQAGEPRVLVREGITELCGFLAIFKC